MAMFPTHIKCSTLAGIGGGITAYVGYGVPWTTSIVGAGLCCIGGILPDIDSGPGIPLREITTFLASVVPTMLITRLLSYHFTQETLILAGGAIYVGIRFGLSNFLRHYTVHRGMFHSFPSMAIFGELTYLLFYGESMFVRLFMVAAVCLGFFIHLLLDEIYSVEWDGRPRVKSSFGTAMKFVGNGWWPNFACYAKLALLTYFVMNDPSVIQQIYTGQGQEVAKNLGQTVKDQWDSALANARKSSGGPPLALMPGRMAGRPTSSSSSSMAPANSNTVPPPSLTWPSPASAGTPAAAETWPVPSSSVPSNGVPARADRASPANSPPRRTALPADNQSEPTAPSGQAGSGRFW